LVFGAVTLLPALVAGCGRPAASLEITSYKDPYFPETYEVALNDCAYYIDPGGDYHVVGRAEHTPADSSGASVTQLVHVHMFWKPRPGKTFDNPTAVDATIRYAIVTDAGTVVYCGTGFVYPKKRWLSAKLIAKVESARLRMESQCGDPPELLGVARVAGKLTAEDNPALAVDLRRQLELCAGATQSE
jgi:hypothetical protein